MQWRMWRERLEQNAVRAVPAVDVPAGLSPGQRAALSRSLRKFHLGESGEGRVAAEIDHVPWASGDANLRALVKLWVREEGRHARILGLMLRELGVAPLSRDWTARGFEKARRIFGVRVKLLVALVAEVAGGVFYELLTQRLPPSGMASAFAQLSSDEDGHLRFQSELFGMFSRGVFSHALIQMGWWAGALAASALVVADHGGTAARFGVSRVELTLALLKRSAEVSRRIAEARSSPSSLALRGGAS